MDGSFRDFEKVSQDGLTCDFPIEEIMPQITILLLNQVLSKKSLMILREDFKVIDNLESSIRIEDIYPEQKIDIVLTKVEDQQDLRDIENLIKRRGAATTIRHGKPNWTDSEGRPPEGLRPGMAEIKSSYRSGELTEKTSSKKRFLLSNLIKRRNIRNVVAVGNDDGEIIFECIKAGIRGFLSPDISPELLKRAIRVIHKGEIWFDRKTSLKIFEEFSKHTAAKGQPGLIESLSKREKEVLHFISRGYKNRDIAENLSISEKTVKNHLSHVYEKLGVEDRTNAVIFSRKIN